MSKSVLPFVNIILKTEKDSTFVSGTVSNEEGRFSLPNVKAGNYILEASFVGYSLKNKLFLWEILRSFWT